VYLRFLGKKVKNLYHFISDFTMDFWVQIAEKSGELAGCKDEMVKW
jgi:hypothetical protein